MSKLRCAIAGPTTRLNLSRFIVAMSCGRAELSGRVLRVGVRLQMPRAGSATTWRTGR
jgi:hypothetical protein